MNNQIHQIELKEYVNPPHTDWISGREYGEAKAENAGLLDWVRKKEKVVIVVDEHYVKAINDSFIKGFFNLVFKELKSKAAVDNLFEIKANDFFLRLFEKNFKILDALYNTNATSGN